VAFKSPKPPDPLPAPPPVRQGDAERMAREAADAARKRKGRAASILTGEKGLEGRLGPIGRPALLGSGASVQGRAS
jgi:hypothetical protein